MHPWKMSVGSMSKEELQDFLDTGNLWLEGDQLQDNYDVALYRNMTKLLPPFILLEKTGQITVNFSRN